MVTLTVTQRQTGPLSYIFSLGSFHRGWLHKIIPTYLCKNIYTAGQCNNPPLCLYVYIYTLNETTTGFLCCLSLLASKVTLGQQITIDGKSQQRNGWTSGASEGRWSAVIETVERRPTTKRLCRRRVRFRWLSRFTGWKKDRLVG